MVEMADWKSRLGGRGCEIVREKAGFVGLDLNEGVYLRGFEELKTLNG